MDKKEIVIVVPYRGIGDIIFHIPLFKGIYEHYKKKIILITNKANKAKYLLGKEKYIKKVLYLDFTREKLIRNALRLYNELNLLNIDLSILTASSKRLVVPFLFSSAKKKIYFKKNNDSDLSNYIFSQSIHHFNEINFLRTYNLLSLKNNFNINNIFVNIDSHHDQNNWKEIHFINLINEIFIRKKINKLFINFAPNKKKKFLKIIQRFKKNKRIVFLYNANFNNVLKCISSSKYVISNESGPVCIGASLNRRVFSIYNPKYTPNLSSKIINKKIVYFNSFKMNSNYIINSIVKKII